MPYEPFLINPPRRRRRMRANFDNPKKRKRRGVRKRKARKPWARTKYGKVHVIRVYGERGAKVWHRSPRSKTKRAGIRITNPIGESLVIAGGNPVRRYIKRRYRYNPRRYRKSYMYPRNPVIAMGGVWDFQRNLPYLVTGGLSAIATVTVPGLLGPTVVTGPGMKYAVQLGTAIGGAMIIDWMAPRWRGHGTVWFLVGTALVAADMLKEYLLKPVFGMTWLGEDELGYYELGQEAYEVAQEPESMEDVVNMEAFPDTLSTTGPFVGAFPPSGVALGY